VRLLQDPVRLTFAFLAIAFAVVRLSYTLRYRGRPVRLAVASPVDCLLLILIIPFGTVLIPAIWILTDWLAFADYARPTFFAPVGALTIAVGDILFWRSHAELGAAYNGFLRVVQGVPLVTTGLYGRVRHPMYASMMVYAVGQLLLVPNWLAGPSNAAVAVCLYLIRIPREEALLVAAFGDEYERYRARTGAVLPRLGHARA